MQLYHQSVFCRAVTKSIVTIFLVTACAMPAQAISLSDVFGSSGATQDNTNKPLPVHQAFNVVPTLNNNKLTVYINVTDGYYAYKDKLKLELPVGVTATPFEFNQTPTYVDDPDFGRVPVFEQSVTATSTLTTTEPISNQLAQVKWQGCAKAGLCYPPEKVKFSINQLTIASAAPLAKSSLDNEARSKLASSTANTHVKTTVTPPTPMVTAVASVPAEPKTTTAQSASMVASTPLVATTALNTASVTSETLAQSGTVLASNSATLPDFQTVGDNDKPRVATEGGATAPKSQDIFGLTTHTGLALLLLFLAGLGLAFTPCVLPMLPIVANIVARQHKPNAKKGLMLTGSYGLGVATSYGLIGALVAVFGQSLGLMAMLQNPAILLGFAGLFILLGLYMLDKLPIRLPASINHKLQSLGQIGENRLGSLTGSFITGFFSALVVSPCVSAPLAGALAGVAMTGSPLLGFAALFLMGLGLSTPLILLGMTQGNFMPKAGEWMHWVKTGFALMMFAVALLLIERIVKSSMMLALWAVWFAVVAVWFWQWRGQGSMLTRALSLLVGIWVACLMVGVALGSQDSWQPLKPLINSEHNSLQATRQNTQVGSAIRITKLQELSPLLQQYPKVVVDVTADWCIECRINDKNLFEHPPAQLANWQVVKLDVTDNTPDAKAIYQALEVFGPPVFLYYKHGNLVARQNGEIKRQDFEQQLANF